MLGLCVLFDDTGKARTAVEKLFGQALADGGRFWRDNYLGLHFQYQAMDRYRYGQRTAKYQKAKRIKWGHNKPLVWSGQSLRAATQQLRDPVARKEKGKVGANVPVTVPWYFKAFRKSATRKAHDKPAELTRTTEQERKRLADIAQESLAQRMIDYPAVRSVRHL